MAAANIVAPGKVGGWEEVANNVEIKKLARLALDEHNKREKAGLELVREIDGYFRGSEYRIILEAKDDGGNANYYEAGISEGLNHGKGKLVELNPLCPIITDLAAADGLNEFACTGDGVNSPGPEIVKLARFAVDDHNKKKGAEKLEFVRAIFGYKKAIKLGSAVYYILLEAKNKAGTIKKYNTVILVGFGFKKVLAFI